MSQQRFAKSCAKSRHPTSDLDIHSQTFRAFNLIDVFQSTAMSSNTRVILLGQFYSLSTGSVKKDMLHPAKESWKKLDLRRMKLDSLSIQILDMFFEMGYLQGHMLNRTRLRDNDRQVCRAHELDHTVSSAYNGYVQPPRRMINGPPPLFLKL